MQPSDSQALSGRMLTSAAVRELCGGVTISTIDRWVRRPELGFPKARKIGDRRFWKEAEILAWLDAREVTA